MTIDNKLFLFVNIAIVLIFLILGLIGYKNGFVHQIIKLFYNFFAIYLSYHFSPIFATKFPLVEQLNIYNLFDASVFLNTIIYTILLFVAMKILYLFISPLLKKISKIPLLGSFNKIAGFIMGLINATIIVIVLSLILSMPLIDNGKQIKENTLFKYCDVLSNKIIELTIDKIDVNKYFDDLKGEAKDKTKELFMKWLNQEAVNE